MEGGDGMSEIFDITDYGNHQPYDEYYSVPFGAMQEEYHNDIRNIRDALFYACNALGQLEGCEDDELISQNNKAIELIAKLLKRKKI